jgi:hypothetical protein
LLSSAPSIKPTAAAQDVQIGPAILLLITLFLIIKKTSPLFSAARPIRQNTHDPKRSAKG